MPVGRWGMELPGEQGARGHQAPEESFSQWGTFFWLSSPIGFSFWAYPAAELDFCSESIGNF